MWIYSMTIEHIRKILMVAMQTGGVEYGHIAIEYVREYLELILGKYMSPAGLRVFDEGGSFRAELLFNGTTVKVI